MKCNLVKIKRINSSTDSVMIYSKALLISSDYWFSAGRNPETVNTRHTNV